MGITQEKPCTHLRIYSTEFKIFILWFIFSSFIHPGTLKLCVSSAQTFTRHAETVATQGTLTGSGKCTGGHFCDLMPTTTCKTALAGVFPSHLRFLEAPEDKAWRNGQGSSGTILRNQRKLPARVSLWECCPVYLWESSVSPGLRKDAWLSFKGKGRHLKSWKVRIPVFDRCVEYTHTEQEGKLCSSTQKAAPFFWAQRMYNLFSKKPNNNNNKTEVQNPDFWVVCV